MARPKLANATTLDHPWEIPHMAVGDGGGTLPTPQPSQTQLVNERRRAAIHSLTRYPHQANQIIAEQIIPETAGGWWVRERGLLDKDGDLISVANCAEYASVGMEYIPLGVGLPANSVADMPLIQPKTGMALVRDLSENQWVTVEDQWVTVEDHRHQRVYYIETKNESIIFALGPIPHNQTLIRPMHEFDKWMGTAWKVDQEALKMRVMAAATQQKTALIKQVSEHINILLDTIAMDNQQTDIQQLAVLKHYRVALMRIDPNTAPEIDWPERPQ